MEEHVQRFLSRQEKKKSDSTGRSRRIDVQHFQSWIEDNGLDMAEVTPLKVEDYLLEIHNDGFSPGVVSSRYSSLNKLYDFLAEKAEVIKSNPMEDVSLEDFDDINFDSTKKAEVLKEDVYYLTLEEVEQLVENVPTPKLRNQLLLRLMLQTGVRAQEASDIRLSDIDEVERRITVRSDKTDSNREVWYDESLDILMTQWLTVERPSYYPADESPYLFCSVQTETVKPQRITNIVKEAAEAAGLQEPLYEDKAGGTRHKITAHTLRHTFAVHSVKAPEEMDIVTLAKLLGHESLETTKKYLRFRNEDKKEKQMRCGPSLGKQ